jgi:hypothetical protein
MSDEITPETPEPPAVAEPTAEETPVFSDLPVFDETADSTYTAIPEIAENQDPKPESQLMANLQLINMKLDEVSSRLDNLTGRVDWIAPRVEWIRQTFDGLIEQFGKITPGQVFSMLRGKPPQGGNQP